MGVKDYCILDYAEDMKVCSKCSRSLSLDKFYIDNSKKDGKHSSCIECNQKDSGIKKPTGKRVYINNELKERMCTYCNKILAFSKFYKVSNKGRYSSICKECIHIKNGHKNRHRSACSVDMDNKKKTCATCDKFLNFECFRKTNVKYNSSGRYSSCIKCTQKAKGVKNPGPKRCYIDYDEKIRECAMCHKILSFSAFHNNSRAKSKHCSTCKECLRLKIESKSRRSYIDYENKIRECSKCHELLAFKEFHKSSKSKSGVASVCIKCVKIYENTEEVKRIRNNYVRERKSKDIQYKLRIILRGRLGSALKNKVKTGSAVKDLGCSIDYFKEHLENKFYRRETNEMMSWDNYGRKGWHIDHFLPLVSFDLTDREQLKRACHYTNLQPLWAEDNMTKGDRF